VSPRSGDSFVSGIVDVPMLLECDWRGQIIWLSDRTRFALGTPQSLAEVLKSPSSGPQSHFRLFQVLKSPEGLLLGAETDDLAHRLSGHAAALRQLELKLLYAYFRLQIVERKLSLRVTRVRRGGGRLAIRQIELERQRVGIELHTGVGQMLAAIRMQLEVVNSHLIDSPAPVRQALDNIAALASGALDHIRSISRRLHPPEWQRLTIEDALLQLWNLSGIPLTFEADLRLHALGREPEPEVKALIYRTAQEGLSNIIGHSKAKKVTLSLASEGDIVMLTLQDDGVGFDPALLAGMPVSVAGGIGLRSLAEQAAALSAKIDVYSGPNGTKLILSAHFSVDP